MTSFSSASTKIFTATSTAEDVINEWGNLVKDKYVFITGASSGIGAEAAKEFARAGAHVWLAGRDIDKTNKVAKEIIQYLSHHHHHIDPSYIHTIHLDLSSINSVRQCVDNFLSLHTPIDILLNNAGTMAIPEKTLTIDNLEMQIGTNHFGHFELTNGLLPALRVGSRIVNVSSLAHRRSPILFDDIHFNNSPYNDWIAYGQSKTANILHAVELNKRLADRHIIAVSLHPGVIETELWRHTSTKITMSKTIPQGASTSVYCAICPTIKGGAFYLDCAEAEPAPYAIDETNAARLWDVSANTLKDIKNGVGYYRIEAKSKKDIKQLN